MSGHISRHASGNQPGAKSAATSPRRPRHGRPNGRNSRRNRPAVRAVLAVLAAVALTAGALTAGTGVAGAAPPPFGADQAQGYIVVLQDTVVDADAVAAAQQGAFGFGAARVYRNAVSGYSAQMTPAQAAQVAADPNVDFVTATRTFHEPRNPGQPDSQVAPNWWLRVGGEPSDIRSASSSGGSGEPEIDVNVAVIDSGVDGSHPDLNVRGGIDCSTGSPVAVTPIDTHGHGTAVAGVIGARNNGVGIVGTAPGTPLWSVRVVDDNGLITEAMLICAIDWVTSTHRDKDTDNDIQVANISIGGQGEDSPKCGKGTDPLHYAICRSTREGVTYAVAAGNSSSDFATTIPATYDEVLTATAMADYDGRPGGIGAPLCGADDWSTVGQRDDTPAFFSNFATGSRDKAHTVAGPGVCMLSTAPANSYTVTNGTSFASPAVAGSVALCISHKACRGSGDDVMEDFLQLSKEYNKRNHDFGFDGDPLHNVGTTAYYGYLTQIAKF